MRADRTSWKHDPFVKGELIPLDLEVRENQMERIRKGLVPRQMEDKWFFYFEEPHLFIHRSWTGEPYYKIKFAESSVGYLVNEALLSVEVVKGGVGDFEYQGKLATSLILNYLLDEDAPFPRPPESEESAIGLAGHHLSRPIDQGKRSTSKKKWWKIWV